MTCYLIVAKPEILGADGIDREYAEFLHRTPLAFSYPSGRDRPLIKEVDIQTLVKKAFLAHMRSELGDNFFSGSAPPTAEFFDEWWTITKFGEPISIRTVLDEIGCGELESL